MKYILPIIAVFSLVFQSCSTDFEVNAPYKETTVVYGLINPRDKEQHFRINRSFLGEADAEDMAKIADSINYREGDIAVVLEKLKKEEVLSSEILTRFLGPNKSAGAFNSDTSTNYLYKATQPIQPEHDYRLVITKKDGTKVTARTSIIDSANFTIKEPKTSMSFTNSTGGLISSTVSWGTAKNGKIYDVTLRFRYAETNTNNGLTTSRSIDMYLGEFKSNSTRGGENMEFELKGETFFRYIASQMSKDYFYSRKFEGIDLIFNIGTTELATYIDVKKPSTGLVQERPEYTNVENGLGIFSSKFTKYLNNIILAPKSDEYLKVGALTRDLNFK